MLIINILLDNLTKMVSIPWQNLDESRKMGSTIEVTSKIPFLFGRLQAKRFRKLAELHFASRYFVIT